MLFGEFHGAGFIVVARFGFGLSWSTCDLDFVVDFLHFYLEDVQVLLTGLDEGAFGTGLDPGTRSSSNGRLGVIHFLWRGLRLIYGLSSTLGSQQLDLLLV
jgi:hypothetical protein